MRRTDSGHKVEPKIAPLDNLIQATESTSNNPPNRESASAFKERRSFISGMASLGAGLAGSAIFPGKRSLRAHAGRSLENKICNRRLQWRAWLLLLIPRRSQKRLPGKSGVSSGTVYTSSKAYPMARPPLGPDASLPPVKPEPWTGIRNALQFGRVCPFQDSAHFDTDGKNLANHDEDAFVLHRGAFLTVPGEDCLRLNLWTPEIHSSRKRPVMVYMHGGGFTAGSGHDLLSYDGESLARNHDAVVVTHNHRLNVYGYLNLGHRREKNTPAPPMLDARYCRCPGVGAAIISRPSAVIPAT